MPDPLMLGFSRSSFIVVCGVMLASPFSPSAKAGRASASIRQNSTASRLRMFFIGTLLFAAPARSARLLQPGCHRALHERKQPEFSSIVAQPAVFEKVYRTKKNASRAKPARPAANCRAGVQFPAKNIVLCRRVCYTERIGRIFEESRSIAAPFRGTYE